MSASRLKQIESALERQVEYGQQSDLRIKKLVSAIGTLVSDANPGSFS